MRVGNRELRWGLRSRNDKKSTEWPTLGAGLVDAVFASLGTFTISVYAARTFSAADLGTFSLFFIAFLLAAVIPTNLVLVPAEVATLSSPPTDRLSMFRRSASIGVAVAAVSVTFATAAAWISAEAPLAATVSFALTAAVCGLFSPLQDHLRRLFHLGQRPRYAATVSVVQFASIVLALGAFQITGVAPLWRPLAALALANIASLGTGLLLSRIWVPIATIPRPDARSLVRSGRWLVALEAASTGALFLSSVLITRLAGASALGHAEAARIIGMPVFVLAVGLGQALGPRCLAAGSNGDAAEARRVSRAFSALLIVPSTIYAAVTAVPWPGNPMGGFIPNAYDVPGLVPATVGAFLLLGLPTPARGEIMGARRERSMLRAAVPAAALQCVAALGAPWLGAHARPLGLGLSGLVLLVGFRLLRRPIYKPGQRAEPPDPAALPLTRGS
jgi:hypothetical protein